MEVINYIVTVDDNLERIDKVLTKHFTDFSRTQIKQMIVKEEILVNDEKTKSNYKCKTLDEITINIKDPISLDLEPQNLNLDIVYEDSDVLVVNKPNDMVVHPASGNMSDTLVNGLLYQVKDLSGINGVERPGIVHRIDKDTTGLLMVAKNDKAHQSLVNQLMKKTVTRKYIALVDGVIEHDHGKIDAPIGRNPKDRKKMAVVENGKHAVTNFHVLERFSDKTLIECRLETGRTHQIRVHLRYIGFPLYGDPKYGHKKTDTKYGQFLHAKIIGFNHPKTNEYLEFDSEIPKYFQDYLETLK